MEHWDAIATERIALADQLDTLSDEQWAVQSLCGSWTVRDVAAHLVVPHKASLPSFLLTLAKSRGNFNRANEAMAAREAASPTSEIVADIRRYAEGRFAPPGFGSAAPLTDVLVHGQDIRVPLGLPDTGSVDSWKPALDFIVSPKARRGFVPKPIPPLRFVAADLDWSFGEGPEVSGPAAAVALALLGRPARVSELEGPGVPALEAWLAG